jgi:hypothetical protein
VDRGSQLDEEDDEEEEERRREEEQATDINRTTLTWQVGKNFPCQMDVLSPGPNHCALKPSQMACRP